LKLKTKWRERRCTWIGRPFLVGFGEVSVKVLALRQATRSPKRLSRVAAYEPCRNGGFAAVSALPPPQHCRSVSRWTSAPATGTIHARLARCPMRKFCLCSHDNCPSRKRSKGQAMGLLLISPVARVAKTSDRLCFRLQGTSLPNDLQLIRAYEVYM
jgi:hypothetical protein